MTQNESSSQSYYEIKLEYIFHQYILEEMEHYLDPKILITLYPELKQCDSKVIKELSEKLILKWKEDALVRYIVIFVFITFLENVSKYQQQTQSWKYAPNDVQIENRKTGLQSAEWKG
jgi:hypothetical protein